MDAIMENPGISLDELSEQMGISRSGVRWNIDKLKREGVIKREGGRKNGRWVVIEK